jgi:hypothetical protein
VVGVLCCEKPWSVEDGRRWKVVGGGKEVRKAAGEQSYIGAGDGGDDSDCQMKR